MTIFAIWHGGISYAESTILDLETFDTIEKAESELEFRDACGNSRYSLFRFVSREHERNLTPAVTGSRIDVFDVASPDDVVTGTPDRVIVLDENGYAYTVSAADYDRMSRD